MVHVAHDIFLDEMSGRQMVDDDDDDDDSDILNSELDRHVSIMYMDRNNRIRQTSNFS